MSVLRSKTNAKNLHLKQKDEIAAKGREEETGNCGRAMLAPTMLRFSAEVIYRAFIAPKELSDTPFRTFDCVKSKASPCRINLSDSIGVAFAKGESAEIAPKEL